jgi:hypothetical protein
VEVRHRVVHANATAFAPDLEVGDGVWKTPGQFGRITTQAGDPRIIQFGVYDF